MWDKGRSTLSWTFQPLVVFTHLLSSKQSCGLMMLFWCFEASIPWYINMGKPAAWPNHDLPNRTIGALKNREKMAKMSETHLIHSEAVCDVPNVKLFSFSETFWRICCCHSSQIVRYTSLQFVSWPQLENTMEVSLEMTSFIEVCERALKY